MIDAAHPSNVATEVGVRPPLGGTRRRRSGALSAARGQVSPVRRRIDVPAGTTDIELDPAGPARGHDPARSATPTPRSVSHRTARLCPRAQLLVSRLI